VLLLLVACSFGAGGYGSPVDGFSCNATGEEPVQARVSLHLVDGNLRQPATMGVGSTGSCNYLVRTEDEDGIVIVRGDGSNNATLDTFLTIWEYAIPAGSGGASAFREASSDGQIRANGESVPGGPETVPLRDGDVIELVAP
jgi:hypothetical protein